MALFARGLGIAIKIGGEARHKRIDNALTSPQYLVMPYDFSGE